MPARVKCLVNFRPGAFLLCDVVCFVVCVVFVVSSAISCSLASKLSFRVRQRRGICFLITDSYMFPIRVFRVDLSRRAVGFAAKTRPETMASLPSRDPLLFPPLSRLLVAAAAQV